jgi:hypothetical protein
MIIFQKHRFVFVHVPKCAGMAVRDQLSTLDGDKVVLGNPGLHETLGPIDYGHIPLWKLREHFPERYRCVVDYRAYALVRNPLDRFGSALRQTIWSYEKRPMTLIPPDELRARTLQILDEVAAELDDPSPRLIFFARQRDFVFDGDKRIVDRVYPVETLAAFFEDIRALTGVRLDPEHRSNQNVDLRFKAIGRLAYNVNDILYRALPKRAHHAIKSVALRTLARKGSAARASGVLDMPEVQDFVAIHYAEDAALHRHALVDPGGVDGA